MTLPLFSVFCLFVCLLFSMLVALLIFSFYLKLKFQAGFTTCTILSYSSFSTHILLKFDTYSVIAKFDT